MSKLQEYLEKKSYDRHWDGSQPVVWYIKAEGLLRSAKRLCGKTIKARLARDGCYYLLIGLAFENLLKGLILIRKNLKIPHKGEYPKLLFGHDLVVLAQRASFNLTADEDRLLSSLQGYVEWRGKYPVPLKDREFQRLPFLPIEMYDKPIDALRRRLMRTFEDECPNIIKRRKTRL